MSVERPSKSMTRSRVANTCRSLASFSDTTIVVVGKWSYCADHWAVGRRPGGNHSLDITDTATDRKANTILAPVSYPSYNTLVAYSVTC